MHMLVAHPKDKWWLRHISQILPTERSTSISNPSYRTNRETCGFFFLGNRSIWFFVSRDKTFFFPLFVLKDTPRHSVPIPIPYRLSDETCKVRIGVPPFLQIPNNNEWNRVQRTLEFGAKIGRIRRILKKNGSPRHLKIKRGRFLPWNDQSANDVTFPFVASPNIQKNILREKTNKTDENRPCFFFCQFFFLKKLTRP